MSLKEDFLHQSGVFDGPSGSIIVEFPSEKKPFKIEFNNLQADLIPEQADNPDQRKTEILERFKLKIFLPLELLLDGKRSDFERAEKLPELCGALTSFAEETNIDVVISTRPGEPVIIKSAEGNTRQWPLGDRVYAVWTPGKTENLPASCQYQAIIGNKFLFLRTNGHEASQD